MSEEKKPFTDLDEWKQLKSKVGAIQYHWLKLSESGTAIEANPATHRIAEMIWNDYVSQLSALTEERDKLKEENKKQEAEIKSLKERLEPNDGSNDY